MLAVMAALLVVRLRPGTTAAAPEMRVEITTPATSDPVSFAISPDGRRLVFVASGDGPSRLWLRSLDAATAQPLAGTEAAAFLLVARRSVGRLLADAKLKRIDIGGGLPQTLAARILAWRGLEPDGVILFSPSNNSPLLRVPASRRGLAATKLDEPHQISHRFPVLPGGRQFRSRRGF
jgi:hypothetical protein